MTQTNGGKAIDFRYLFQKEIREGATRASK